MEPKTYNSTKNPVITKNFDCSTGHITAADNRLLKKAKKDPNAPVIVYEYREGYFIYVPTEQPITISEKGPVHCFEESEAPAIEAYGFSKAFVNLLRRAASLECKYLQLDGDAMEYEDLPTFEW